MSGDSFDVDWGTPTPPVHLQDVFRGWVKDVAEVYGATSFEIAEEPERWRFRWEFVGVEQAGALGRAIGKMFGVEAVRTARSPSATAS
jgi:hypothetical protein